MYYTNISDYEALIAYREKPQEKNKLARKINHCPPVMRKIKHIYKINMKYLLSTLI
jgi:hypothetical protein